MEKVRGPIRKIVSQNSPKALSRPPRTPTSHWRLVGGADLDLGEGIAFRFGGDRRSRVPTLGRCPTSNPARPELHLIEKGVRDDDDQRQRLPQRPGAEPRFS